MLVKKLAPGGSSKCREEIEVTGPVDTCKPHKALSAAIETETQLSGLLSCMDTELNSVMHSFLGDTTAQKSEATSWQQQHQQQQKQEQRVSFPHQNQLALGPQTEQLQSKSCCGLGHYRAFEAELKTAASCTGLLLCLPNPIT